MLPIPAANIVVPKSAICLHSAGSAISPAPTTPSSSPPIDPTSHSTEIPLALASAINLVDFSMFSSIA